MAEAAKRPRRGSPTAAARALPSFLRWCAEAGVQLSPKVGVSREGTVAAYGLLARESLGAGEELFSIPRTALLSQHTSTLAPLLRKEEASLQSSSGWVPLLISLLYECTVSNSHWGPYFSLWPQFTDLDHPMFWGPEERARLLQGTGILEAVEKDLVNIEMEYSSIILPFLKAHPDLFNPKVHTLELYRRLVAFVMAYSFQEPLNEEEEEEEPNPPVMVPLADLLNHVANHNANLEFSPESLKMVTTQPVRKGQEIFNTYGEMANWQLLHMYGFAEAYPGNTNDSADIQMLMLLKAALQATDTEMEEKLVLDQWKFLCHQEMVGEEGAFVIGWERVFTEEELSVALQVLTMSAEEFKEFKDQEAKTDRKGTTCLLESVTMIPNLSAAQKKLLFDATLLTLKGFSSSLKEEETMLGDLQAYLQLSRREQFALQVRYGQKKILHQLLELAK
ncbi:PREDICTED: N-lysine methyltransferase SETD6 isoform X3 [Thamnophis sirtalis]|uniref:N-lysine methyltransferase SETD6 n=1 Tax=Thamnophis sirtalis TaxID=35019 RepID=A0A6I9YE82_9SAUR|nr:PREDICTED: N-lysine methyltransferase SETD6 isoform X3 [Thamnophis sirtalis]